MTNKPRQNTNALIEAVKDGSVTWEAIAGGPAAATAALRTAKAIAAAATRTA